MRLPSARPSQGTGIVSTNLAQRDYSSGVGAVTAQTAGAVRMRETVLSGLRYSHYSAASFGYFYPGGEVQGMFTRPEIAGDWRFTPYDYRNKATGETLQLITWVSAPAVHSVRGFRCYVT